MAPILRCSPETSYEVINSKLWFFTTDHEDEHKGKIAVAVKKGFSHICIDLPPLLSVEATGVCILILNTELFLAAVYKCLQRPWSDTDITELLGFRNKYILAGDLNTKYPVRNSKILNPSGLKPLELFVRSNYISTSHCQKSLPLTF
jgi:hypothetical protein